MKLSTEACKSLDIKRQKQLVECLIKISNFLYKKSNTNISSHTVGSKLFKTYVALHIPRGNLIAFFDIKIVSCIIIHTNWRLTKPLTSHSMSLSCQQNGF